MTLEKATKRCTNLGGRISVPQSKMDNHKILSIIQEHKAQCLFNNAPEKTSWLGLMKSGRSWHERQIGGSTRPITYSNWRYLYDWVYTAQHLCAFINIDGT